MGKASNPAKKKKDKKVEIEEEKKEDLARGTTFTPRPTAKKEVEDIWSYRANESNTHDRRFTMNSIRTSKYTAITFLPKNLFEQFSKMANVYFLFIMVLQIIPQISISGGQPAILLPLLFVCAVSAVKDLFEDIKRHKADD
jgi:magnesium-transporting ATPase (P-type)